MYNSDPEPILPLLDVETAVVGLNDFFLTTPPCPPSKSCAHVDQAEDAAPERSFPFPVSFPKPTFSVF